MMFQVLVAVDVACRIGRVAAFRRMHCRNDGWPLNSWPITENSNGYQTAYIRLLARYVK